MLAPMCGITDSIFRTLCYEMGCETAFTEMVSAMGYLCAPDQRATQELIFRGSEEPKLILQLFGRDPDTVAEAAKRFKLDYVREFSGFVRESVYFDDLDQATATLERAKEGDAAMAIRVTDQKKRKVKAEWLRDEKWGEVL